jgi:hypothetical protein
MIRAIRCLAIAVGMAGALSAVASTGTALAAPAGSAGSAPSASAPTSTSAHDSGAAPAALSDCPATNFCFWVNAGYNDGPGRLSGDNPDWRIFAHGSCQTRNWSDCASSGFNNGTSGLGVEVWQNINYGGASACLPRGWRLDNFAGFVYPDTNVGFNDSISSNFWTSIC